MIIDAHHHPDWHGHDLPKFLANMEANRIDVAWLLNWECHEWECATFMPRVSYYTGEDGPIPFSRCISYAERAPGRFVLGFAPDPRRPDALMRMQGAMEIYGARVCGELKLRMMYDNPDALRLFRFCGKNGLPVVVHLDYDLSKEGCARSYWYGGGIEALERAIRVCPETIFLGHAPGFWAHISGDNQHDKTAYPKGKVVPGGKLSQMLREYPNLYCDHSAGSGLNAFTRDPEFAKDFILEFQDRILYARDCFDNEHQAFYESLNLPQDVLEKIYSGNALKLVPLSGAKH